MRRLGTPNLLAVLALAIACTPMYRRELSTPTVRSDGSIGPESRGIGKARRFAVAHFKCPGREIAIQQVSDEVFNANGCGRTATIICAKGVRGQCVAEDDAPVVVKPADGADAGGFDAEVARSSLKSVTYTDCGVGGRGRIQLTIEPSGKTSTVNVIEGTFDEATTKCLVERFGKVSVPPFKGGAHAVRWNFALPEE
ncbi:MAG: hypothetical protein HYV09_32250 [Deltaproteobacteria bacterium]|nr:hypothetical protein [Deltaproteobacteria bacterium]